LGHWGEDASKTVEALASELPIDAWVREAFYDLLADRSLAGEVAEALADHAHAPPIRDALVDRLTDPDDRVRFWATSALCQRVADDPDIATLLPDMLDDEDPEIRAEAAVALIRQDGDDPSARRILDALRADGGWLARSLDHRLAEQPSPTAAAVGSDTSRIDTPSTRDPKDALDDRSVELLVHSTALDLLVEVHERLAPYADSDGPIGEHLRDLGDVPGRLRTAVDDLFDPTMPTPRPWYRADMVGLRIDPALVPHDPEDPVAIAHAIRTTPGRLHRRNDRRAMLDHLAHPDPIVRMVVVEALAPLVAQADVHAVIVERLTTDTFPVRLATARTLCRLPDREIVPADLWTRLEAWLAVDSDPAWTRAEFGHPHEVRDAMARRIGRRAARDRMTHRRLVEQLDGDRFAVRLGAVLALLERPGSLPSAVQRAIVRALRDRRGHESLVPRLAAAEQWIDSDPLDENGDAILALADEALRFGTRPWEHVTWAPAVRVRAIELLDRLAERGPAWTRDRRLDIARDDRHADVRDAAYRSLRR
ncbi:MAG: HEAT repeat domain-containing protein, partial [Acidobacteriota bacterium]